MEFGNREVADYAIDRLQDQPCLGAAAVADLTDTMGEFLIGGLYDAEEKATHGIGSCALSCHPRLDR